MAARNARDTLRCPSARVRESLKTNGPAFSATRMVRDYVEKLYTVP